jgi:hypothetical protein
MRPITWGAAEVTRWSLQEAAGLWPANYLTLETGDNRDTMVLFDPERIRADIRRLFGNPQLTTPG